MRPAARTSIIAVAVAIAALAIGLYLGGHPSSLPSVLRNAFVASSVSVRTQLENDIQNDFYRPVSKKQLETASLSGIVDSLKDPYSKYFTPSEAKAFVQSISGQFEGVGMTVDPTRDPKLGLYVQRVFPGSPAQKAGIVGGARIVAVNGSSILSVKPDIATARIRGPAGTSVRLTFVKPGRARHFSETVERKRLDVPLVNGQTYTRQGKKLGYVRLLEFDSGAHGQLRDRIDSLLRAGDRGVLLDLRGNPGGEITEAQLVASSFLPKDRVVVSTKGRSVAEHKYLAVGDPIAASIPVVVLVDGNSASASEIVTGALRDWGRATVVGTKTFGKGVFQTTVPLDNDGLLKLTVGSYYLPKGSNLQGHGIVPQVKASDNPKTKPDEALETALRTLAAKAR